VQWSLRAHQRRLLAKGQAKGLAKGLAKGRVEMEAKVAGVLVERVRKKEMGQHLEQETQLGQQ
jgi:hypothetical protein